MPDELTAERWRRIRAILDELLQLPQAERQERLQRLAADDPGLHARVRSLLAAEEHDGPREAPVSDSATTLAAPGGGDAGHDDGNLGARQGSPAGFDRGRGSPAGPDRLGPPAAAGSPSAPASTGPGYVRFPPGTVLSGRYRVATRLGRGGMGEVFRADDLKLGQAVALKFLPSELASEPQLNARFVEEIKLARQISHPNVCRVYDVGEAEGQLFLSMELIEGEDLAGLLTRIGRLPEEKAIQIAQQLCAGLAAAHDQGILHRDLKPANVMLDERGRVRITDFGLAGFAEEIHGRELLAGTPAYMAPEQLAGESVSVQSDLYALGLLLYELFTGRRPYRGESRAELLAQQRGMAAPTPSSWVEGLDPTIETAILRCLEADPAGRPPSARAVAAALPGGDPLAAALEAGETPSPELVAAAGPEGVIRPRTALLCLAVVVAGLLFNAHWVPKDSLVGLVPWTKPTAALASDAREILADLGYPEPAADAAWRFVNDWEYLQHLRATDPSPERWRPLEAPGQLALQFVYRQAPRRLAPLDWSGRVVPDVPGRDYRDDPPAEDGDILVVTDLEGRLRFLRVVSGRTENVPAATGAADAASLFAAAGLELSAFESTAPVGAPPVFAERRLAWNGRLEAAGDLEVRIEAAFVGDRPVFFECVYPFRPYWQPAAPGTDPAGQEPAGAGGLLRRLLWPAFSLSIILLPVVLALRNLRLGRGDRRGATRLAAFVFAVRFCWWVLAGHHVSEIWWELDLLTGALARSLFVAAVAWVLYVAIEPTTRRLWPRTLVSWSRLLEGRFRDPLVGREILLGLTISALAAPLELLYFVVPRWLAWPDPPRPMPHPMWPFYAPSADPLLGARDAIAAVGTAFMGGLWATLGLLALLIFLLVLTRRRWLAIGLFIPFVGVNHWAVAFTGYHWLGIAVGMAFAAVLCVIFVRFGLLAATVSLSTFVLFWVSPVTDQPAAPYFGSSLFTLAVVGGLAAWAAWNAVGKRRWLGA